MKSKKTQSPEKAQREILTNNTWQLWKKEIFSIAPKGKNKFLFQTEWVFIRPDKIINEHRVTNPYGCIPFRTVYEFEQYCIWDFKGQSLEFLKQIGGWKRAKHRMTDEQLEKGLLLR